MKSALPERLLIFGHLKFLKRDLNFVNILSLADSSISSTCYKHLEEMIVLKISKLTAKLNGKYSKRPFLSVLEWPVLTGSTETLKSEL